MRPKFKKIFKIVLFSLLFVFLVVFCYLFVGKAPQQEKIDWGVNFSQKYAAELGLDWKETYLAILDDMGAKKVKVAAYWDIFEGERGKFYFSDLDWQVNEAGKRGADVILVIGMKTSRWPECHIPEWAKGLSKEEQQDEILKLIENIVFRYENTKNVIAWQVENEPFFPFGECPWTDKNFLKTEVAKVHELDTQGRPVIISDSGEGSLWISAARIGDVVGTTMYKKVWFTMPVFLRKYFPSFTSKTSGFYIYYPFPPVFYGRKAEIIKKVFGKDVICVELQAEPWAYKFITELPLEEQEKTMNIDQLKANIEFAKKTGLKEFYLWGAEWMYWMKEKQGRPEFWQEAKKLFN